MLMLRHIFIAIIGLAAVTTGCSRPTDADFETTMSDAVQALAENNIEQSQQLADQLRNIALGPDSDMVTESQAARLSILYMKLSEHAQEDENVADATQLFRRAFRLSSDSLKSFYEQLPLDDTRHYVLLRRLGISIDNPVDLSETDMTDGETSTLPSDSLATQH